MKLFRVSYIIIDHTTDYFHIFKEMLIVIPREDLSVEDCLNEFYPDFEVVIGNFTKLDI